MLAGVSLLIISLLSATLPPGWHGVPSALAKAGGNGKGNNGNGKGTPVVMKRTAMMQRRHPRRTRKRISRARPCRSSTRTQPGGRTHRSSSFFWRDNSFEIKRVDAAPLSMRWWRRHFASAGAGSCHRIGLLPCRRSCRTELPRRQLLTALRTDLRRDHRQRRVPHRLCRLELFRSRQAVAPFEYLRF